MKYESRLRLGNKKFTEWQSSDPTDDAKQLLNRAGVTSITINYSTNMTVQIRRATQ